MKGSHKSYKQLKFHYARCDRDLQTARERGQTERIGDCQRELLAVTKMLAACPEWQAVAEALAIVGADVGEY